MAEITHKVDSEPNPTLDQLQAFIDQCRELGMPGDTETDQIGHSQGYHFTGSYTFTPNGKIRAKHTEKKK